MELVPPSCGKPVTTSSSLVTAMDATALTTNSSKRSAPSMSRMGRWRRRRWVTCRCSHTRGIGYRRAVTTSDDSPGSTPSRTSSTCSTSRSWVRRTSPSKACRGCRDRARRVARPGVRGAQPAATAWSGLRRPGPRAVRHRCRTDPGRCRGEPSGHPLPARLLRASRRREPPDPLRGGADAGRQLVLHAPGPRDPVRQDHPVDDRLLPGGGGRPRPPGPHAGRAGPGDAALGRGDPRHGRPPCCAVLRLPASGRPPARRGQHLHPAGRPARRAAVGVAQGNRDAARRPAAARGGARLLLGLLAPRASAAQARPCLVRPPAPPGQPGPCDVVPPSRPGG